jgi:hypothetical protein
MDGSRQLNMRIVVSSHRANQNCLQNLILGYNKAASATNTRYQNEKRSSSKNL